MVLLYYMKKLESRLQFLIGLSLFFPIIMQAVFDKETSKGELIFDLKFDSGNVTFR